MGRESTNALRAAAKEESFFPLSETPPSMSAARCSTDGGWSCSVQESVGHMQDLSTIGQIKCPPEDYKFKDLATGDTVITTLTFGHHIETERQVIK